MKSDKAKIKKLKKRVKELEKLLFNQPEVSLDSKLGKHTYCKVWMRGALIFDGVSKDALLQDRDFYKWKQPTTWKWQPPQGPTCIDISSRCIYCDGLNTVHDINCRMTHRGPLMNGEEDDS